MQIPLRTSLDTEAYIRNREWRVARMPGCPLHPAGGCSFARHGSYARVTPRGLRIARWYCPEGHRTFSLLPDFLAARMTGLLTSIKDSIRTNAVRRRNRDNLFGRHRRHLQTTAEAGQIENNRSRHRRAWAPKPGPCIARAKARLAWLSTDRTQIFPLRACALPFKPLHDFAVR